MTLTPEDVHKKTFTPVRLREGYDMGEVDQFLDDVEAELTRLLKENADLRSQLAKVTSNGAAPSEASADKPSVSGAPALAQGATAPAQSAPVPPTPPVQVQAQAQAPEPPQPVAPPSAPSALPAVRTVPEASHAAARLLEIATNNADQLVNEAQDDADRIIGEARTKAERLDAESRSRADRLEADARNRVQALDSELSERREQMLGHLEREKQSLARELDELRAFEREYRSRLKSYFENQLLALDGKAQTDDVPLTPSVDGETPARLKELLGDQRS